jgi:hypothetical protein
VNDIKMTTKDTTFLEISDNGNLLRIEVVGQIYPKEELIYERNWLNTIVQVEVGSFLGKFSAQMQTFDFEIFKKELEFAYKNLKGGATLEGVESQVNIHVSGDGVGHFIAKCHLLDKVGIGNELICDLNMDQTQLPEIIDQLNTIVRTFPPIR